MHGQETHAGRDAAQPNRSSAVGTVHDRVLSRAAVRGRHSACRLVPAWCNDAVALTAPLCLGERPFRGMFGMRTIVPNSDWYYS